VTSLDTPDAPSDAELIARVRSGDLEAYGELFARHHHAAERMARQLVPAADADDLAGDAFAKVLDALRNGGGPDVSFRAYLLTTVRRVHVDRLRAGKKVQTTGEIESYEREPESFDDPTVTGFESGAAAKAFASLPERWQAVLWHTEVEGEKPAAVAPLLGLTANGVSALAYRAREGLRQAYLQQHLADVAGDRCRWTTERLGAYVRGGLTKRENKSVREHLDDCVKCTAVYLELVEVNSALPALLAPALLGTAGLGYLAASGTKVGGVSLLAGWWKKASQSSTQTVLGAGAAAVVVTTGIIGAVALWGSDPEPPATAIGGQASEPTAPTAPPVVPPTSEPPGVKPPTTAPTRPTQPTTTPTIGPTIAPTTAPTGPPTTAPTTAPTSGSTTAPTSAPTTTPTSRPDTPPPTPTTPVHDEGLLTISAISGGSAPAVVAAAKAEAAGQQRFLTIDVPANNSNRVVIRIVYGAALTWPVGASPAGWTCTTRAAGREGTCTATNPRNPQTLPIEFANPTGGTTKDRTYTVTARTGRLYDDDSERLTAPPVKDENLLRISKGKPHPDRYYRTITVDPRAGNTSPVTVKIQYGGSLAWPVSSSPAGWSCDRATRTCTAANRAQPAPLYATFAVPKGGSAADRTFSVTARAGAVYDIDFEVLAKMDESLLSILTPRLDSPLLGYERFLKVKAKGRVTLEIWYGSNLTWRTRRQSGWTCSVSSEAGRAICTTGNYKSPLKTAFDARRGSGASNTLTVQAIAGGRVDVDAVQITPRGLL